MNDRDIIIAYYDYFFCGATALIGPRLPHCWGF